MASTRLSVFRKAEVRVGMAEEIDVTKCPDCDQQGRYDGRVLIGGRGIYKCPEGHRWQEADEKPTTKGTKGVDAWRREQPHG